MGSHFSPCDGNCMIDHGSGYCKGCYRTMREIVGWHRYTEEEKRRVEEMIKSRKAESERPRSFNVRSKT